MKTIPELKERVQKLVELRTKNDATKQDLTKAKKEIPFLTKCIQYLESEPTEDFVKKQLKAVKAHKKRIDEGFEDWKKKYIHDSDRPITNLKSFYRSEMGLSKFNSQLKYLNFISNA